jgi:hypothetical protein
MLALRKTRTPWCINESFVQRRPERDPGGLQRLLCGEACVLRPDQPRVA